MKKDSKIGEMARLLLGTGYCILLIAFFVISCPVYLFRQLVKVLAKLFNPSLGAMLNGQSALFAVDYFAVTPPRSNLLVALAGKGSITLAEVEGRVTKAWIEAPTEIKVKFGYHQFQQYPVRWLGFTFWKSTGNEFSVKNHVYQVGNVETPMTEQEVTQLGETLLNSRIPAGKSPWEMYLIENYKNPEDPNTHHMLLYFKLHHCLSDGMGVVKSLVEGVFEGEDQTDNMRNLVRLPKWSWAEKVRYFLTFPFCVVWELSYYLSNTFRESPFKIPDKEKEWYQVLARSSPIPLQLIKDIKNAAGVSFTGVLLSAVSAAVTRTMKNQSHRDLESIPFMSVLPARFMNNRKVLANHMTGVVFDLPLTTKTTERPVDRLYTVDAVLQKTKRTVIPVVAQYLTTMVGAHFNGVTKLLSKNKIIPISMSNTTSVKDYFITRKSHVKLARVEAINGGFQGDAGIVLLAISYDQEMRILVCADRAVMSKKQVEEFGEFIVNEINVLGDELLK